MRSGSRVYNKTKDWDTEGREGGDPICVRERYVPSEIGAAATRTSTLGSSGEAMLRGAATMKDAERMAKRTKKMVYILK